MRTSCPNIGLVIYYTNTLFYLFLGSWWLQIFTACILSMGFLPLPVNQEPKYSILVCPKKDLFNFTLESFYHSVYLQLITTYVYFLYIILLLISKCHLCTYRRIKTHQINHSIFVGKCLCNQQLPMGVVYNHILPKGDYHT